LWGIMFRIAVPILRPAIASVFLLTFLFTWSEYLFALTLTSSAAVPLTVGTANFVTSAGVRWGEIAAATVLAVVPPMLLALVAQKHLVRGLTAGAVKG
ncbi:MAG: carbohydrate ABC transporter permease, partial [Actinomycetota bacterium]|nr:carbohydrate ABC transporter permease [Actinomycetota bacterium]